MIVLLHGMGMSAAVWDDVVRALATAGDGVVAYDLPGHGARAGEAPLDTVEAMADDVALRVEARTFVVVGHSMGGAVAQSLVQRHAERITRAVLVASALWFPAAPVMLEAARADIAAFRALFKNAIGASVRGKALVDACSDAALLADIAACARFDARSWDAVAQRATPSDEGPAIVVVGGDLDEVTPPKAWRRLAERWQARLVEAGARDHALPETYASEIARLCA